MRLGAVAEPIGLGQLAPHTLRREELAALGAFTKVLSIPATSDLGEGGALCGCRVASTGRVVPTPCWRGLELSRSPLD